MNKELKEFNKRFNVEIKSEEKNIEKFKNSLSKILEKYIGNISLQNDFRDEFIKNTGIAENESCIIDSYTEIDMGQGDWLANPEKNYVKFSDTCIGKAFREDFDNIIKYLQVVFLMKNSIISKTIKEKLYKEINDILDSFDINIFIKKEENYRSCSEIINLNNSLRSDLIQVCKNNSVNKNEIKFIYNLSDDKYLKQCIQYNDFEILKKYKKVYEKNNDLVGWIKIKDTNIDYPVMQTKDDYSYYLKRNFNKKYSIYGTTFVGEGCGINPNSDNVIIYGHNMKNGTMFADLNKYKYKKFYESHKEVQFDTLTEEGTYKVVYAFVTEVNKKDSFKYYEKINWNSKDEFNEYVLNLEQRKLYDTGEKIKKKDKLLTLSTCEKASDNSRMVVVCKKKQNQ